MTSPASVACQHAATGASRSGPLGFDSHAATFTRNVLEAATRSVRIGSEIEVASSSSPDRWCRHDATAFRALDRLAPIVGHRSVGTGDGAMRQVADTPVLGHAPTCARCHRASRARVHPRSGLGGGPSEDSSRSFSSPGWPSRALCSPARRPSPSRSTRATATTSSSATPTTATGRRRQDTWTSRGNFVLNQRGSSPFPYYRESVHGTDRDHQPGHRRHLHPGLRCQPAGPHHRRQR